MHIMSLVAAGVRDDEVRQLAEQKEGHFESWEWVWVHRWVRVIPSRCYHHALPTSHYCFASIARRALLPAPPCCST